MTPKFEQALKQAQEALNLLGTGVFKEEKLVREGARSYVHGRTCQGCVHCLRGIVK